MENKNFSYAIRMIIFLILICVLPISIAKIIKSFTKKDSNQITKNELNSEIKKYIENNAESVLEILLNKYFSLKKEEKSNFEIKVSSQALKKIISLNFFSLPKHICKR